MGTFTNAKPDGASGTGTSFTSVSGARSTSNVSSSAAVRDVDEALVTFEPYQTPILTHLLTSKFGKKPTGNQKFEWMTSSLLPRVDTVTLSGGAANEDNITVGDSTLYQVGTKFVVDSTGEVCIVDSIASSQIDVTKVGSGNITAAASKTVHFMGDAFEQGSSSATAVSANRDFPYNYVEIIKRAVHETESQQATQEYGPEDWNRNKLAGMSTFKMDVEMSFLKGIRSTGTGLQNGSHTQFYAGGVFDSSANFISTSYAYIGNEPGEDWFFDTFLKGLFSRGSSRKRLYAGANLVIAINDFSKVKQQTKVEESVYGVDIQRIKCPFGVLELAWHPMLDGDVFSKQGVALDLGMDYVKYRYLAANGKNRDLKFRSYPHFEEQDSRKGEWICETGIQLSGDEYHAIIQPSS